MSSGEEPEHGTSLPLAISHAEMNAAIDEGDAPPLSQSHGWLARYLDAWWVEYEGGWLRVIDAAAARELDQVAARLAEVNVVTAADEDHALLHTVTSDVGINADLRQALGPGWLSSGRHGVRPAPAPPGPTSKTPARPHETCRGMPRFTGES